MYCDQEPLRLLNVIEDDCCVLGVHIVTSWIPIELQNSGPSQRTKPLLHSKLGERICNIPFLSMLILPSFSWLKKSSTAPNRGLEFDGDDVPITRRRTVFQKNLHFELMLDQIANFCPVISRSSMVKNSTSISSVCQAIRSRYGFHATGAGFLDFSNIKLEVDERPDDLFQRLMSLTEDNLLVANSPSLTMVHTLLLMKNWPRPLKIRSF